MRASCILASAAALTIATLLKPFNRLPQPPRRGATTPAGTLPVEPLEGRRMLASVNLSGGVLSLSGNNGMRNTMTVMRSGTSNYVAKVGSLSKTVSASSVSEIRITDLKSGTFFAELVLTRGDGSVAEIDCRPSDAIALLVRRPATPFVVAENVLAEAAG